MLFLYGCSKANNIKEIRMKDNSVIEISQGDFSYEDKKLILVYEDDSIEEIALEESMIPEKERLKFFRIGEHDVTIVYGRLTTSFSIKVNRRDFEAIYELVGYTCKYDGLVHKVELNNELPEGAKIEYLYGNSFINVGEYEVKAVISKDGYNPMTLSTTLIIEKADYDESEIIFNDLNVVYDGKAKTIEATNIPDGVTVKYDIYYLDNNIKIKEAKEAGSYKVVAHFSSLNNNYNQIADREAILTIDKAKYDMSNVKFNDYTKTYDGLDYEPRLANLSSLPQGVSVSFKCYKVNGDDLVLVESNANAGVYKFVASFSGDSKNYEAIRDLEASLTVEKKLIEISDKVSFESKTVNYDGTVHSLELIGTLPEGVEYTISNNGKIYVGEYLIRIKFEVLSENNKLDVQELTAYLIINKIDGVVMVFDETLQEEREIRASDIYFLDGELLIDGFDLSKYKINKCDFFDITTGDVTQKDDLENNKEYGYSIQFSYVDTTLNSCISLAPITGLISYNE
jgi:hypothetical protein